MKVSFSVAARDRAFAKAMRRIRPDFRVLLERLDQVQLDGPTPLAILIGLADGIPDGTFDEVQNSDGYFQELVGCSLKETDDQIKNYVFNSLRSSVARCPLPDVDHRRLDGIFNEFAAEFRSKG